MGFPNEKQLKKIRDKTKKAEAFKMLSPDADELSRFRFSICQDLLAYAQKNNLSTTEMAKTLKITKADMSRIFNHRIERFSTDKLVTLYGKVYPKYKLRVS